MKKAFLFLVFMLLCIASGLYAQTSYGYTASLCTKAVATSAYSTFKTSYFDPCGSDKIRVKWGLSATGGKPDETVSEGVAYGMLMAAYAGDQASFNGLWKYYNSFPNANGLMHWHTSGCSNVVEQNAATDAEEDAAIALVIAHYKWGSTGTVNYEADAKKLIGLIKSKEVDGSVLKPGDMFGGASLTNISYFAPGYYKIFGTFTNDASFWNGVADKCYEIINNNLTANNASGGLVSDWCGADGKPAGGKQSYYSYDACRTPWRIAVDYYWFGDARAKSYLDKTNGFITKVGGITMVKDGYNQDGTFISGTRYHNTTFVSTFACAGIATNQATVDAYYAESSSIGTWGYFDSCFDVFGKYLLSGLFAKPGTSVTTFTITASASTGGTITPSGVVSVDQGSSKDFNFAPTVGYKIADIKVDNISQGAITSYAFNNITTNHAIAATFVATPTYTITASAGSNGTISPNGATVVAEGANTTYSIAANVGYKVGDVIVDGASKGSITTYTIQNIKANHTITATFVTGPTYTITATAGANGTISPAGSTSVGEGASKAYTITPALGFKVEDVKVNGNSVGAVTAYTVTNVMANTTISASFIDGPACTLLSLFEVPIASALPMVNTDYDFKFILGNGGPSLSNISKFSINWDLANKGLYTFAVNTTDGQPDWYVSLLTKLTQTFSAAEPSIKITSSGIQGLDGDYWVNMDGANFVMVAKNGSYAIYFSKTAATPKNCTTTELYANNSDDLSVTVAPNPVASNGTFVVHFNTSCSGTVSVIDVQGVERIKQSFVEQESVSIDSNLTTGIYFLSVNSRSKVVTTKIIIK